MITDDVTNLLINNTDLNSSYFCFNHSLINVKDNIFIVTYRCIKYNAHDKKLNITPWKIWWDGYKLIKDHKPIILSKTDNLKINNRLFQYNKTRDCLSVDIFLDISKSVNLDNIDKNLIDYDSTGMAVLKLENDRDWSLIYNNNNIFDYEVNQDTRVSVVNNQIFLSYNMFEIINDRLYVKMKYRELKYNPVVKSMYLSLEKNMLDAIEYKIVEKNCVFDNAGKVLYMIGPEFMVIDNDVLVKTEVEVLKNLIDIYGSDNMYISLGTPGIKYNNNYLAVGHIKFDHRIDYGNTLLSKFISQFDFSKIIMHGRFIYMMFFFEYSDNNKILRLSNFFIPTNDINTLDYLLVFPSGLTKYNDNYIISYGEGDIRCKMLYLTGSQIDNLLKDVYLLEAENMSFFILTPEYLKNKKKLLHIGYFNEYNCGDDAFAFIFKYLNYKYYPDVDIVLKTGYDGNYTKTKYDMITIGGGDIINNYFLDKIQDIPSDITINALSVGIPYTSCFNKLDKIDTLYIRNSLDLGELKKLYPNKQIVYFPDLAFLLKSIITPIDYGFDKSKFKIGICLTRTFFNDKYRDEYISFVHCMKDCIFKLLELGYIVYLIPFGTHIRKVSENDMILMKHIKHFFLDNDNLVNTADLDFFDRNDNVRVTYSLINNMDFCICSRFHAHIFCTALTVPFISYSSSRKCGEYMKEMKLDDLLMKIQTNSIDLPCNFDSTKLLEFALSKIRIQDEIKNRLTILSKDITDKMDGFINYWLNLVNNNLVS